jgi:hypothetical protein
LFEEAQKAFELLRPQKSTGSRADHGIWNELVEELINEDLGVTTNSDLMELKKLIRALKNALVYADHHHEKLSVPAHFSKFANRRKYKEGKNKPDPLSTFRIRSLRSCSLPHWSATTGLGPERKMGPLHEKCVWVD